MSESKKHLKVTESCHRQLKAAAAEAGKSIIEFAPIVITEGIAALKRQAETPAS